MWNGELYDLHSNILFIMNSIILVDISPFHVFLRCLYIGNVQVFEIEDLVAVSPSRFSCSDT